MTSLATGSPHGHVRLLICDSEGALTGDEFALWCCHHSIQVRRKEEGIHAQMVERHHELLRQLLHRLEAQRQEGGLAPEFEDILAELQLGKNLLLFVGGKPPCQGSIPRDSLPAIITGKEWMLRGDPPLGFRSTRATA